jgi:cysteine desulfurase
MSAPIDKEPVYLDNNGTTKLDPEVLKEMMPYLTTEYGNANSLHRFGQGARVGMRKAIDQIYAAINATDDDDVIIGSCATEANNTVMKSVLHAAEIRRKRGLTRTHVVTSSIEHPCIRNSCEYLETQGIAVTYVPVNEKGIVTPEAVRKAIEPENTVLVSIMWVNNETGLINPIADIAKVIHEINVEAKRTPSADNSPILFHTDAVQAVGKVVVDVQEAGVDMMTVSAHKFHGPKGVGFLYVRAGSFWLEHSRGWFTPLLHGGEQMAGRRAGTINTPGIVGLGAAIKMANEHVRGLDKDHLAPGCHTLEETRRLRDKLEDGLLAIPGVLVIGDRNMRTCNTVLASFKGVEGEAMLWDLDAAGIAASTGSACASESLESNPTFVAMSVDPELAHTGIRFSLSKYTTEEEIDRALEATRNAVRRLRDISGQHPTM